MSKDCLLLRISSNNCLKSIISELDYISVLKLVKYNKKLQQRLDISIKDYSLDYEIRRNITKKLDTSFDNSIIFKKIFIGYFITRLLFKAYQGILAGLYIFLDPYIEIKEIKEGFEKQKKFLQFLDKFMYVLEVTDILSIFYFGGLCNMTFDHSFIFFIAIFIDAILQLIIFGITLWILVVLYNDFDYNWIRVYYLVFIIITAIYIICLIVYLIIYLLKFHYKVTIESFITKFQGIKIKDFKLENSFSEMEPQEKKNSYYAIQQK